MSDIEMKYETSDQAHDPYNLQSPSTEANSAFGSGDFEDQARRLREPSQASTTAGSSHHNQPSGDLLVAIPKHKLLESGSDYAFIFTEMQIRPECWDEVVYGIIHPIRAKRIKSLKTATAAMIKDLTHIFLRGYGNIIYHKDPDKWLVDEAELQLAGKERMQFTHGDYGIDGPNAHFYAILEPMWWHMRSIIFQLKPSTKKRGPKKNAVDQDDDAWQGDVDTEMDGLPHKEKGVPLRGRGRPPKEVVLAAMAGNAPKVYLEQIQQKTVDRIEQQVNLSKQNGTWDSKYYMSAIETDEAVQDLIVRLHQVRYNSDPRTFTRSWDTHMARLEEIEAIDELKIGTPANPRQVQEIRDDSGVTLVPNLEENAPSKRVKLSKSVSAETGVASSSISSNTTTISGQALPMLSKPANEQLSATVFSAANLANEPFNTNGPPSILNQIGLGQQPLLPPSISVYISADPPRSPYHDNAYHWPCAPIGIADGKKLFDGIDMRVDIVNIRGYIFSYGWHDMMRSIDSTARGKRDGFDVLLRDIALAARKGVTKWRVKVLVLGVAPMYPSMVCNRAPGN